MHFPLAATLAILASLATVWYYMVETPEDALAETAFPVLLALSGIFFLCAAGVWINRSHGSKNKRGKIRAVTGTILAAPVVVGVVLVPVFADSLDSALHILPTTLLLFMSHYAGFAVVLAVNRHTRYRL